jgi:short-subunit dehydrogenase
MQLQDAVVLVTGASGGIGAACARRLASRGAQVIVAGRDPTRLAAVAADVGGKPVAADLVEPGGPERAARAALDVFGRVDAVLHCAGVGWHGPTETMTAHDVDELVDLNVRAPMQLTRLLLGEMRARGSGHVAFVASIAGWTGVSGEAVYAATKAALLAFAESLRLELDGSGVGVSVVTPGAVRTDFFARRGIPYSRRFPRPVAPDTVAAAAVRGIERDRPHRMLPRWLALAPAVRVLAPPVYRSLRRRFG